MIHVRSLRRWWSLLIMMVVVIKVLNNGRDHGLIKVFMILGVTDVAM